MAARMAVVKVVPRAALTVGHWVARKAAQSVHKVVAKTVFQRAESSVVSKAVKWGLMAALWTSRTESCWAARWAALRAAQLAVNSGALQAVAKAAGWAGWKVAPKVVPSVAAKAAGWAWWWAALRVVEWVGRTAVWTVALWAAWKAGWWVPWAPRMAQELAGDSARKTQTQLRS